MDKTLTRKIGYVKPRTTKEVKSRVPDKPAKKVAKKDLPPKTEKQEIKEFVTTKKATVASVRKWLESHPFFKVKPMCQEIGIDDSNFKKALADGAVPSEHIAKVVKVISQYGFKCLLFLLLAGSLKAQDTKRWDTAGSWTRVGPVEIPPIRTCFDCMPASSLDIDALKKRIEIQDIDNIQPLCGSCNSKKGNR